MEAKVAWKECARIFVFTKNARYRFEYENLQRKETKLKVAWNENYSEELQASVVRDSKNHHLRQNWNHQIFVLKMLPVSISMFHSRRSDLA